MPDDVIVDEANGLILVKLVGGFSHRRVVQVYGQNTRIKEKHRIICLLIGTKEQVMTPDYSEIIEVTKTISKDLKRVMLVEDISGGKARSTEPKFRFIEAVGIKEELDGRSFISEDEGLKQPKN